MISAELIAHVDDSIAKALRHESGIDESVLTLTGFSTGVMRRLMNNLCRLPKDDPAYLEIGLYAGATFCAAINNNPKLTAIGIEDFSQPFGRKNIREELENNIARYRHDACDVTIIDADCFVVSVPEQQVLDIFFYDGEHSVESQSKALPHFLDAMAPLFLFVIDDTNWKTVQDGTRAGFDALAGKVAINKTWVLTGAKAQDDPIWHNGMHLYACSKI